MPAAREAAIPNSQLLTGTHRDGGPGSEAHQRVPGTTHHTDIRAEQPALANSTVQQSTPLPSLFRSLTQAK